MLNIVTLNYQWAFKLICLNFSHNKLDHGN